MILYFIVAAVAYLLGSIPFGFLLVLLVRKQDIRAQGSGNIGATNVMRSGAKGLGLLTFVLDGGKGYAAVIVAEWLARNEPHVSDLAQVSRRQRGGDCVWRFHRAVLAGGAFGFWHLGGDYAHLPLRFAGFYRGGFRFADFDSVAVAAAV
jgi:glycerol-3-phosphate acyltransferase PlsY